MLRRSTRRRGSATVALLLLSVAIATTVDPPPTTATTRYLDAIFDVDVRRDIVYGSALAPDGSNRIVQLRLDLYTPRGDTERNRPVFVYAHGGAFLIGDKSDSDPTGWATRMAQRGYVAASIQYRLGPNLVTPPVGDDDRAQIDRARIDMQSAVRWVKANSASLGVDPDRIAVAGSSAGAITALGVAINSTVDDVGVPVPGQPRELSASVCGAVSISGANDPPAIDPGDAGAIFFHGRRDGLVPYELAVVTRDAMIGAGLQVKWNEYDEGHVNEFSTATRNDIRAKTIRWVHDHVATAAFPCSPAVADRWHVPSAQQTVIHGLPGRSAVVSLFAVDSLGAGYVQVLPCGATPGSTANVNTDAPGQTRSSVAVVRFDDSGTACIYNQSRVHLVADLQGYFAVGAFDDVPDARLLDTRPLGPPPGGSQTPIVGRPSSTAVVSVVATQTGGPGYLQVLPCGATPGAYANLNADRADQTRGGLAFIRFDADGRACVYNQTSTHIVVDLQGYMADGSFDDQPDQRLFDTRSRPKPAKDALTAVVGPPGSTMVMTLVATEPDGAGFLQALSSCDQRAGGFANLYVDAPGQIVSALAIVGIPASGAACTYANVATHVVADRQGFMAPGAFDDIADVRILDTRMR